jgi:autophagy-related protein 9
MLLSRAAYLGAFSNERCFCPSLKSYIDTTRFSGFTLLLFLLFSAFYVWQIINFLSSIRRLVDMYNFYTYLLKIPDVCDATFLSPAPILSLAQADIQTIAWSEVVRRIEAIREENPTTAISSKSARNSNSSTTAKLDAHDIANRIMRQENYLIALFNKELLDLSSPIRFSPLEQGKGRTLTRALEWNLRFCLMEYLFDRQGRVRKVFLQAKNRTVLIEG